MWGYKIKYGLGMAGHKGEELGGPGGGRGKEGGGKRAAAQFTRCSAGGPSQHGYGFPFSVR